MQEAIKNHKILVGMDREMVIYAMGRPPKKIRDKDDTGADYEEWIYGDPPQEVQFVRFQGNFVARLEIMTVDGEKVVRTQNEVDLPLGGDSGRRQATGSLSRPTLLRCDGRASQSKTGRRSRRRYRIHLREGTAEPSAGRRSGLAATLASAELAQAH